MQQNTNRQPLLLAVALGAVLAMPLAFAQSANASSSAQPDPQSTQSATPATAG